MSDKPARHSTTHATFIIEREYSASPQRGFHAWPEPKAKVRWVLGSNGWKESDHTVDFRLGRSEHVRGASL